MPAASGTVVDDLIGDNKIVIASTNEGGVALFRGVAISPEAAESKEQKTSFKVWLGVPRAAFKRFDVTIDIDQTVHEIVFQMQEPPKPIGPDEIVGTVHGKPIYGREITDKTQREIAALFLSPIMKKFREDHADEFQTTDAERQQVEANLNRLMTDRQKQQVADDREELAETEKRIEYSDLTSEERAEVVKQRDRLKGRIARPNRFFARFLLKPWKVQRYLYDHSGGGRVPWQQAGLEAFDATKTFIEQQVADGQLTFANDEIRGKVLHYWNRRHVGMLGDADEIEKAFLNPPWLNGVDDHD